MIECGEKQLKAAQSSYEERQVEENILELKLKEAGKIVLKVDDKLYDLEKYAIQMEAVSDLLSIYYFNNIFQRL